MNFGKKYTQPSEGFHKKKKKKQKKSILTRQSQTTDFSLTTSKLESDVISLGNSVVYSKLLLFLTYKCEK